MSFLTDDDLPFDLDERNIADQGDLAVAWMRDPDGNVLTVFGRLVSRDGDARPSRAGQRSVRRRRTQARSGLDPAADRRRMPAV